MNKAFFITGTGTGIGKTTVTCSLIRQLKESGKDVMAIKPVISGWEDDPVENDTLKILTSLDLAHTQENIIKVSPWRFKEPLAPSMAARRENKEIDYSALVDFCKTYVNTHEYLLCEGAGGTIVPLNRTKTTLDLMCNLGFPAILVAGSYLGAISHTITAVKSMESAGINISSIIVNESENGVLLEDTVSELQNFLSYQICPIRREQPADGLSFECN